MEPTPNRFSIEVRTHKIVPRLPNGDEYGAVAEIRERQPSGRYTLMAWPQEEHWGRDEWEAEGKARAAAERWIIKQEGH